MIKLTQENLEVIRKIPNKVQLTQECLEYIHKPTNKIQATQICLEVILLVNPENYTDSAANCNFVW